MHTVPSGLKLEVLSQKAASIADEKKNSSRPPIVFVHGSYHAAWCWREHFFQYFTARGHDVYAVSMRRGREEGGGGGTSTHSSHGVKALVTTNF